MLKKEERSWFQTQLRDGSCAHLLSKLCNMLTFDDDDADDIMEGSSFYKTPKFSQYLSPLEPDQQVRNWTHHHSGLQGRLGKETGASWVSCFTAPGSTLSRAQSIVCTGRLHRAQLGTTGQSSQQCKGSTFVHCQAALSSAEHSSQPQPLTRQ